MGEKLLSSSDLAARWGMSPRTLSNWRTKGIGPPCVRIQGLIRYKIQDVLDYEKKHFERVEDEPEDR